MRILLIGGSNSLMNQLILKFQKEGHRLFLLTGSKYREEWYEKVFEKYDFPYDSPSMPEVFESVDPDVTIFLGAFDSSFHWKGESHESVRFVGGLMNLLTAFAAIASGRRRRFVYLSSGIVFGGAHTLPITETAKPDPKHYRSIAVHQGEELCADFAKNRKLDVLTLRLDELTEIPHSLQEVRSTFAYLALAGLRDRHIEASPIRCVSPLFLSDAVHFIADAALAAEHQHQLYQISSGEGVSERELAELLGRCFEAEGMPITISENEQAGTSVVLGHQRYQNEFGMNRFAALSEIAEQLVAYLIRHPDIFLKDRTPKESLLQRLKRSAGWAVHALIPFFENMVLFIPFFMLNNRATGSQYFSRLDFYLLYVLLFAIMYGQIQATFSAMLATAGFIFRQMYHRTGIEVLLDYNTYVWIAQLFILGMVVGYLHDKLAKQREEAKEDHSFLSEQLVDIKDINSSNVRVKDALETQVTTMEDSIGRIYAITSALDQYSPDQVLFYAAEIMEKLLKTTDVAIYRISNGQYARLFTATSKRSGSLGNSIRYRELPAMMEALDARRVFINKQLDDAYPMLANAIYEAEEMRMLVLIWGIPWERMTLGEANLLAVISMLIQNAVLRADRYLNAISEERFVRNTRILNEEAFTEIRFSYEEAGTRHLTSYALLTVQDPNARSLEELESVIRSRLRPTDYLGINAGEVLQILLTNTDRAGALRVAERMQEAGLLCDIEEKRK